MARNIFIENLRAFNKLWGIKKEPDFEQVVHMLAIFGLKLIPSSRPIPNDEEPEQ